VTEPLWSVRLDDEGGRVDVFADGPNYRLRVTLPHPDYLGPDVVGERVITRERFRKLWRAVR
jgi:hypothetical protein